MAQVTKRWDVVAGRKYTTRENEERTHWINVGRATEWDGEQISIELHSLPVFPEWNGRLSLFVPKDKDEKPQQRPQRSAQAGAQKAAPTQDPDDDIPF